MKRSIRWAIQTAILLALVWVGFIEGVEGAQRLVIFVTWLFFALSLVCFTDDAQAWMRKVGRPAPEWLDVSLDVLIVGVLVWHGAWVTGGAYLAHMAFTQVAMDKALGKAESKPA